MRGLYGKLLPAVFCTGQGTKERGQCGIPKAKLSRGDRVNDVDKGFVTSIFPIRNALSATRKFHHTLVRLAYKFVSKTGV